MPEAGAHHVLNASFFTVGQFDPCLLLTDAGALAALVTWLRRADAGLLPASLAKCRWRLHANTGVLSADRTGSLGLRFEGLPVPLRIVEMVVRFHEVVDGEVVFAIEEPGATLKYSAMP